MWRVLSFYGVDSKITALLADLHTGTQAAVKPAPLASCAEQRMQAVRTHRSRTAPPLAGSYGDWFDLGRGVRQGCVIAPLLFNIYFDSVVRLALPEMPEGCGARLAYRAESEV